MSAARLSPEQHAVPAREAFLRAWQRPCACQLELRAEGGSLRCANCDRAFVRSSFTESVKLLAGRAVQERMAG